ncbi:MAG: hypothetical protein KBG28_05235 [Kofleriaceae bacterium]|jgi:hypothetical protein|nr:hypothetical protein [Kofleriaceae bacterium]MBP6835912.1 hypothetical protein [Kofleriaceae bacterium]MBP9203348.1 hypothetical protein [Kofleriaceae bacterium]
MTRTFVLGALLAMVAACGSARVVNRSQYGGTIALNGDRGKAMEGAHREMAAHCGPNNYTIVQEGEVVVGQDTAARADTAANDDGSVTQTAGSSTRDATEWRVTYQCGGAPAQPQPAPAGPPGPPPAPPPGQY